METVEPEANNWRPIGMVLPKKDDQVAIGIVIVQHEKTYLTQNGLSFGKRVSHWKRSNISIVNLTS